MSVLIKKNIQPLQNTLNYKLALKEKLYNRKTNNVTVAQTILLHLVSIRYNPIATCLTKPFSGTDPNQYSFHCGLFKIDILEGSVFCVLHRFDRFVSLFFSFPDFTNGVKLL